MHRALLDKLLTHIAKYAHKEENQVREWYVKKNTLKLQKNKIKDVLYVVTNFRLIGIR